MAMPSLARGLEHRRGQPQLFGLPMALADVPAGADHAQGSAVGVAFDDPTAVFDPYGRAVEQHGPVLHRVDVSLALQMVDHVLPDALTILGVYFGTLLIGEPQPIAATNAENDVHP